MTLLTLLTALTSLTLLTLDGIDSGQWTVDSGQWTLLTLLTLLTAFAENVGTVPRGLGYCHRRGLRPSGAVRPDLGAVVRFKISIISSTRASSVLYKFLVSPGSNSRL